MIKIMATSLRKEKEKDIVKKILYDHLDILFGKLDSQNEKIDNLNSKLQKKSDVSQE